MNENDQARTDIGDVRESIGAALRQDDPDEVRNMLVYVDGFLKGLRERIPTEPEPGAADAINDLSTGDSPVREKVVALVHALAGMDADEKFPLILAGFSEDGNEMVYSTNIGEEHQDRAYAKVALHVLRGMSPGMRTGVLATLYSSRFKLDISEEDQAELEDVVRKWRAAFDKAGVAGWDER